ncbi:MAG: hypothetical protein U0531_10150 [Dehalococcoidia bacterium]
MSTILEAMAMSKAVIVTATRGQRDVVRGRLTTAGPAEKPQRGPATFGVVGPEAGRETGLYVPRTTQAPSPPSTILRHPDDAQRMEAAGLRRLVERHMNLEQFVQRIRELLDASIDGSVTPALVHSVGPSIHIIGRR